MGDITFLQKQILDAIDTVVTKKVESAGYNKTILATIIGLVDKPSGKYKVKYQDSIFFAQSEKLDVEYNPGELVYILIPNGDMNNTKIILGGKDKIISPYIPVNDSETRFEKISNNLIIYNGNEMGLCSYKEEAKYIYYNSDIEDSDLHKSVIELSPDLESYLVDADSIILGAEFNTHSLNLEQRNPASGNFGIGIAIENTEGELEFYNLTVADMVGDPYNLGGDDGHYIRQYKAFDFDKSKCDRIIAIYIYDESFPNLKEGMPDDIFVKGFELYACKKINQEDYESTMLIVEAPNGTYFDDASQIIELRAKLKTKGQPIEDNNNVAYYWFEEDSRVRPGMDQYDENGGRGWSKLEKNGNVITLTANDVKSSSKRYKCVAVYQGNRYTKIVSIGNKLESAVAVNLKCEPKNQFYYDVKEDFKIICGINDNYNYDSSYSYNWGIITQKSDEIISINKNLTSEEIGNLKDRKLQEIEDLKETNPDEYVLRQLQILTEFSLNSNIVSTSKLFEVRENYITSSIENFNPSDYGQSFTIVCTIVKNDTNFGTGKTTIFRVVKDEENSYFLEMIRGTKLFKYDEEGLSPVSNKENPLKLESLSFNLISGKGEIIEKNKLDYIKWFFPSSNTMLVNEESELYEDNGEYKIFTWRKGGEEGLFEFNYGIAEKYDNQYSSNDIKVEVGYDEGVFSRSSSFLFVKDGAPGTNATELTARIVPISVNRDTTPRACYSGSTWSMEGISYEEYGKYFKVEVNFAGTEVQPSDYECSWGMMENAGASINKPLFIITNTNNPVPTFSFHNYSINEVNSTIIKCTVTYNGNTVTATYPITMVTNSDLEFKLGSGYDYVLYNSDGAKPECAYNNPFIILKNNTAPTENIEWSANGDYFYSIIPNDNSAKYIPIPYYNGIDTNIQIICKVGNDYAYKTIHFLINRFGFKILNDWDGNSIVIDEDRGYILSPTIGAGTKNPETNTFTGVVMGEERTSDGTVIHNGLLAYNEGQRTAFINAENGSTILGSGSGSLIIDPTSDVTAIYNHNFFENYDENTDLPISYEESNWKNDPTKPGLMIKFDDEKPGIYTSDGSVVIEPGNVRFSSQTQIGDEDNSQSIIDFIKDNADISLNEYTGFSRSNYEPALREDSANNTDTQKTSWLQSVNEWAPLGRQEFVWKKQTWKNDGEDKESYIFIGDSQGYKGRNLLSHTSFGLGFNFAKSGIIEDNFKSLSIKNIDNIYCLSFNNNIKWKTDYKLVNKAKVEVTVSFSYMSGEYFYLSICDENNNNLDINRKRARVSIPTQGGATKYDTSFVITYNGENDDEVDVYLRFETDREINLYNVKFEIGNVPTDWTPSINDTERDINSIKDDLIKQEDKAINTYIINNVSSLPSKNWNTQEEKKNHSGDLMYYRGETVDSDTSITLGKLGDLNRDGVVDSNDYYSLMAVLQYNQVSSLDSVQTKLIDINGDGVIDGTDLELLGKYIAGEAGAPTEIGKDVHPKFEKDKVYKWTGEAWKEYDSDVPMSLFDSIDGKSTIYYGNTSLKPANVQNGDYLVDGSANKTYRWDSSRNEWIEVLNIDDAVVNTVMDFMFDLKGSGTNLYYTYDIIRREVIYGAGNEKAYVGPRDKTGILDTDIDVSNDGIITLKVSSRTAYIGKEVTINTVYNSNNGPLIMIEGAEDNEGRSMVFNDNLPTVFNRAKISLLDEDKKCVNILDVGVGESFKTGTAKYMTIAVYSSNKAVANTEYNLKVKLEYGVTPTEWTPAIEDIVKHYDYFYSDYQNSLEELNSIKGNLGFDGKSDYSAISQIYQTANDIQFLASKTDYVLVHDPSSYDLSDLYKIDENSNPKKFVPAQEADRNNNIALYTTSSAMDARINVSAENIKLTVSDEVKSASTRLGLDNIVDEIKGENGLLTYFDRSKEGLKIHTSEQNGTSVLISNTGLGIYNNSEYPFAKFDSDGTTTKKLNIGDMEENGSILWSIEYSVDGNHLTFSRRPQVINGGVE